MRVIAFALLMSAVALAQTPGQSGTQGAVQPRGGGIRGRVVAADTNRPVTGARITVTGPELATPRNFVADVEGKFEIFGLRAGRYTLAAAASGYVSLSYGQTRPFERGRPIALTEGQVVSDVTLTLPRGGAIAGTVHGDGGRPVINADVTALRVNFVRGVRQFEMAGRADANDLGEFRIYGLAPGTYYIAAAKRFSFSHRTETGYAPMFFPGTHNAAEAKPVVVAAGQTAGNINFVLDTAGSGALAVTLKDMSGKTPNPPLASLRLSGIDVSSFFGGVIANLDLQRGRVLFIALPPGEYVAASAIGYNTPPGPPQAGSVKIQVNGNVVEADLNLSPMQYATGRIVFDAADGTSLQASEIKLSTIPADPAVYPYPVTASPKDDLTFALPAPAGRQLVRATVPPGWGLKAVRVKGEDVIDSGIEFGASQNLDGLEIELTRRLTNVTGTVRGPKNESVNDFSVVVFSRDRREWTGDSRTFAIARPDQSGAFAVGGLKPGEYFAAALEYLNPGEAQDPALLTRLQRDASSFILGDSETKTLTVRLVQ